MHMVDTDSFSSFILTGAFNWDLPSESVVFSPIAACFEFHQHPLVLVFCLRHAHG